MATVASKLYSSLMSATKPVIQVVGMNSVSENTFMSEMTEVCSLGLTYLWTIGVKVLDDQPCTIPINPYSHTVTRFRLINIVVMLILIRATGTTRI